MMRSTLKFWVSLFATLMLLVFSATACASAGQSGSGQLTDTEFETKVLEVIRKNPKAILDSIQAYDQAQRQQQAKLRDQVLQQIKQEPRLIIRNSPVMGATAQKIILAEFSDFQCPFCAKAHAIVKEFMAKHKDEVTLVYKQFPLVQIHPQALPAALASWAAGQQGKFWEYHDGLFEQQEKLDESFYPTLAQSLKLDVDKFNQDRNSEAAKTAVQKDMELGQNLGIRGTPTFIFNGFLFSGVAEAADLESYLAQIKAAK
ncbi:DsbA family protein [Tumidithrix elongata]